MLTILTQCAEENGISADERCTNKTSTNNFSSLGNHGSLNDFLDGKFLRTK
jgi:hypothetical protein